MVCSAAFDRDDEFFALAGVGKRIKIYEAAGVAANAIGLHYPSLDILSRWVALADVSCADDVRAAMNVQDK